MVFIKTINQYSNNFLLGIMLAFSLLSCSNKNEEAPQAASFATAHVIIGNETEFDFKGDKATGISASETKLGIGFLDTKKGNYIYLAVQAPTGLKEATYSLQVKEAIEDGVTAYVTLDPDEELFSESFDTKRDLDGDFWNDGTGSITITSLNGNWVEGTFSAVAYSKSGDEAQIKDGKFKAEVKYKF